jgi:RNA recognition motif-containing protein
MSTKKSQLFISRIPHDIKEEEVREMFIKFGEIKRLSVKTGYAFLVKIYIF